MGRESCMPLWYGDFLASTNEWPGEACSLYLTALAQQWVSPSRSLPADLESLRSVVKWNEATFQRYWPVVASKFEMRDGRLVNMRLEEHRESSVERTHKLSESGRRGAEARWHRNGQKDGPAKKKDGHPNGRATKKDGKANGHPNSEANENAWPGQENRMHSAMPPTSPTIPTSQEKNSSGDVASGSDSQVTCQGARTEPDAVTAATRSRRDSEEQDRARRRIPGRLKQATAKEADPDETRRKVLKALEGGLDVATIALSLHLPLEQVRQWQQEAQS